MYHQFFYGGSIFWQVEDKVSIQDVFERFSEFNSNKIDEKRLCAEKVAALQQDHVVDSSLQIQ